MKVVLLASITADGFIAQSKHQTSLAWTSKEDTQFFIQKTKEAGVLIMGSTTFETIKPKHLPFSNRTIIILTKSKKFDQYDSKEIRVEGRPIIEIIRSLEAEGTKQVIVAGGASVYTQFINAGLVDELFLTVEPIMFGDGIKLFSGTVVKKLNLVEVIDLSKQTKVLHYLVENNA